MKGARRRSEKSGSRTLGHIYTPGCIQRTIDRGINLLIALYDALLSTFFVLTTRF